MLIHFRFGLPTLLEGPEIIARYKGPEFSIGRCRHAGHSSKSRMRSHSSPSVDHILRGKLRVLFLNPPCLVLFVFFFQTEQLCYHLPFAKWKNLERIVRVVLASETKSSAIFLKLTLVMATPLWLPNFPSLQNNSSSTWACGWALLSHFPLPWYLRHFVLEIRVSWDFLNSRPQIMDA